MSKTNNRTSIHGTTNGYVGSEVRGEMPRGSNTPPPPPPSQTSDKTK